MQIVTSWMQQGIEQGITRDKNLVIRLIERKWGAINLEIKTHSTPKLSICQVFIVILIKILDLPY